jgi:hypothetical protein
VTYILGGHQNWVFSTSKGAVPIGHEFPKPLNRSQEGVIFKYFAGFPGDANVYDYYQVRQNALESYNMVWVFLFELISKY